MENCGIVVSTYSLSGSEKAARFVDAAMLNVPVEEIVFMNDSGEELGGSVQITSNADYPVYTVVEPFNATSKEVVSTNSDPSVLDFYENDVITATIIEQPSLKATLNGEC